MAQMAKRRRTAPCFCVLCNGKERDHRTVKAHLCMSQQSPILPTSSVAAVSNQITPEGESQSGDDDNDNELNSNIDIEPLKVPKHQVNEFIVREVTTKLMRGHSRAAIEEHLANAAKLVGDDVIPLKWCDVLKVLKSLGYENPQHFKVCVSASHSELLKSKVVSPCCRKCKRSWDACIDYYCLGLNFKDWFLTLADCERLMSHWLDRDSWFNIPVHSTLANQTEVWHGSRFRELSYFWDNAKKSLLPEKCSACSQIISSETIANNLSQPFLSVDMAQISVPCPHCESQCLIVPRYMFGDPRNQVVLIHEDGWNPHIHWGQHSISTITITHGCMSKLERSDANQARVYSFIPIHQLPCSAPHKFDAFFEPLVSEIEDLYMDGAEVFFRMAVSGHSSENDVARLRVLPLLITADSKAHAEIGLTTAGGFKGCRRCFLSGQYIPERRHYYYGQFRQRFRFPAPVRSADTNRQFGKEVDAATSSAVRQRKTTETGVTGETIFFRFYDLCGFNPVKDLVVDVMHALLLNLVRSELENHILGDLGQNSSLRTEDRLPVNGGLLSKKDLSHALAAVNWTVEMKDGRVPSISETHVNFSKHRLGGWTAEDLANLSL